MLFLTRLQQSGDALVVPATTPPPTVDDVCASLPGLVWWADRNGQVRCSNTEWQRVFGGSAAESGLKNLLERVHEEDRRRGWPEGVDCIVYRLRTRGGFRWMQETVRSFGDGYLGVTTAAWSAALADFGRFVLSEADLPLVRAEAAGRLVAQADFDGAILVHEGENGRWEVVGSAGDLPHEGLVDAIGKSGAGSAAGLEYPSTDGNFPLSDAWMSAAGWSGAVAAWAASRDGRGCWLIGLTRSTRPTPEAKHFLADLSGLFSVALLRAEAEQKLQESRERALQIQKLEAVGLLAGGVAHDFNNLLTAIRCFAELLRDDTTDEIQKGRIDDILHASGRASHLVRQLLSFSRQEMVQVESIDLHVLVDGLRGFIRSLVSEHVLLDFLLGEGAAWCRADPKQIEQVLFNLCLNARDVMPVEGRLTIAVSAGPDRDDGAKQVRLSVQDTGPGVPPEVQASLFQPFFTTKAKGRGTGLGLASSRSIARSFGGDLTFETSPGRGTVFHLDLPEVADPIGSLPEEERTETEARCVRILLVEDDDLVRAVTMMLAESLGHHVVAHGDPSEALLWAEGGGIHEFDLLITDVVMPGMNGHELAKRLTAMRPGLPVLYMSGYVDDPTIQAAVQAPGVAFLAKPFSNQDFTTRLNSVLLQVPS